MPTPSHDATVFAGDPWLIARAFVFSGALIAAVDTGLLQRLRDGPGKLTTIGFDLQLQVERHPKLLRLVQVLRSIGIINIDGETVTLSSLAAPVLCDPFFCSYLRWKSFTMPFWHRTALVLRGQSPSIYETDLYDLLSESPEQYDLFQDALVAITKSFSPVIGQMIRTLFGAALPPSFVDVGAGAGHLEAHLLEAFPEMRAVLIDRSLSRARQNLACAAERCTFLERDFFAQAFPSSLLMIFAYVLCDWNNAHIEMLLDSAADSLDPGGFILLLENITPAELNCEEGCSASQFIIAMETEGFTRTAEEWCRLIDKRFALAEWQDLPNGFALIAAQKRAG